VSARSSVRRLPEQKSLYQILPKGTDGGKEFSRIVDLLIFHEGRRSGRSTLLFSDAAGDYRGLDSMSGDASLRREGATGYQYKFYPSPLSSEHRRSIEESLLRSAGSAAELKLKRWVLVTPEDLLESSTKAGGGDVSWFQGLRGKHSLKFELEHWGHKKLLGLFMQTPFLCLYYYPDLVDPDHRKRRTIADTRKRYDDNLLALYRDVQFVGMSVYKPEATRGVAIQDIYIPLTIVSGNADPADDAQPRQNPLKLLDQGLQNVLLGDPGAGKSTLMRFLALAGISHELQDKYGAVKDARLPVYVTLRKYGDELKARLDLGLLDYIAQNIQADFSLEAADRSFFEFYLESGRAILLFDGLDELPSPQFKSTVRDRIRSLLVTYPGNTAIVTSRVVGYEEPFRFDANAFPHWRLAALRLPEVEQFVRDWYRVRIENTVEREHNVKDLLRIVREKEHAAIRELARNPLLLTIVTLVHRIDAVLPDERVVLYQKCTETLLNTWHTWKYRETEQRNRGRIERRNRARMEAIAHWMQIRSAQTGKAARTVAAHQDLKAFLAQYIRKNEPGEPDTDPADSAEEFLEFVKRRAGLLIEAGDGLYSFVHLTFQEYLTSTFLATDNEAGGAPAIWTAIEPYCSNPKWHEVVRLLIAGLRSFQSQAYLIERLLEAFPQSDAAGAVLLGGLLLDRIEPAEVSAREISQRLVEATATARTSEGCDRIVGITRTWKAKDTFDEDFFRSALTKHAAKSAAGLQRARILAPALGMDRDWTLDWQQREPVDAESDSLVRLLLLEDAETVSPATQRGLESVTDFLSLCLSSCLPGTHVAALLQPLLGPANSPLTARLLFQLQLSSLIGGASVGPFKAFTAGTLATFAPGPSAADWGTLDLNSAPNPAINSRLPLNQALEQLNSGTGVVEKGETFEIGLWKARAYLRARVGPLGSAVQQRFELILNFENQTVDSEAVPPNLLSLGLDAVCEVLRLAPVAQWKTALNARVVLPSYSRFWILETDVVEAAYSAVGSGTATDADYYVAAWHVVLEGWGALYPHFLRTVNHSIRSLPAIAERSEHPALRIALAVRGLLINNDTPIEALTNLAADVECATLLQRACLMPDPEASLKNRARRDQSKPRGGTKKK